MALGWKKGYIRYKSFFLDIYRVYKIHTDLKMFLEILLSLATVSFFAFFALRPTAFTITELLEEIRAKEDVIDRMDQKIRDLDEASTIYQAEPRITLLDQALPDTPLPEDYARQIQGLTEKSGVTLNSMVIGETTIVGESKTIAAGPNLSALPEGSGEISFSLNTLGTYENLSSFMISLENLRRPLKIDNSTFNVAQVEGGSTLSLSVNGRIPYYKQ